MKFAEGFFFGTMMTMVGCVAFKFLFPESSKEMCESAAKISKDMGKELKNMM